MKVILFIDNNPWDRDTKIFSSRKALLAYFQRQHPEAKSLRIKELGNNVLQILNHNTPVSYWRTDIVEMEIDKKEKA